MGALMLVIGWLFIGFMLPDWGLSDVLASPRNNFSPEKRDAFPRDSNIP